MRSLLIDNPDLKQRRLEVMHNLVYMPNLEEKIRRKIKLYTNRYANATEGLPSSYIQNAFKQAQSLRDIRIRAVARKVVQQRQYRFDVPFMTSYEGLPAGIDDDIDALYNSNTSTAKLQVSATRETEAAEQIVYEYAKVSFAHYDDLSMRKLTLCST